MAAESARSAFGGLDGWIWPGDLRARSSSRRSNFVTRKSGEQNAELLRPSEIGRDFPVPLKSANLRESADIGALRFGCNLQRLFQPLHSHRAWR